MKKIGLLSGIVCFLLIFSSCGAGKNNPGRVYMPDMHYSQAQETYAAYGDVRGDSTSAFLPVEGTVARGYLPYPVANTPEGYEESATLTNPVEKNQKTMEEGARLFGIFCGVCHGETGAGDGPVAKQAADYGLQPPSYWDATIIDLPDGKMFHSMTYGKNLMGSYASQLSKEERWMIVHHINKLQDDNRVEEVVDKNDDMMEGDGDADGGSEAANGENDI